MRGKREGERKRVVWRLCGVSATARVGEKKGDAWKSHSQATGGRETDSHYVFSSTNYYLGRETDRLVRSYTHAQV